MSSVRLAGVVKRFGDVVAVAGVDLEVESGEFLVVLGPSGCGKTTLMRIVAGLETPTAGQVHIRERDVTALPPRKRGIAMVFQSYALYPHMTVANNIAFPLKAQGRCPDRTERAGRVRQAARKVSIDHLLDRRPRQLSGGERQRVAIARAIVTEPEVLLLDEPLSNLDAKLRAYARDELKFFQRELGITTIFVTHDQIEAMGLGDRIVVMEHGLVQQVGAAAGNLRSARQHLRRHLPRLARHEPAAGRRGRAARLPPRAPAARPRTALPGRARSGALTTRSPGWSTWAPTAWCTATSTTTRATRT